MRRYMFGRSGWRLARCEISAQNSRSYPQRTELDCPAATLLVGDELREDVTERDGLFLGVA